MTYLSILGFVAAALTTAAFIPQAVKTIRTGSAEDLSLATFSMLLAGTLCWFAYGYGIGDVPLMAANGITASLAAVIFAIKAQAVLRKQG